MIHKKNEEHVSHFMITGKFNDIPNICNITAHGQKIQIFPPSQVNDYLKVRLTAHTLNQNANPQYTQKVYVISILDTIKIYKKC